MGFPNVGKSTLLSVVSKAHPKIANYHFTTLYPNLGVVYVDEGVSFVMADVPGIIEGAADGVGLGHDFLRHIDRCRLLVHIVDVSGSEDRDPVDAFEKINEELRQYSPELAELPMLVAPNKADLLPPDSDNLERLRAHVEAKGYEFYTICAATTQGTRELMKTIDAGSFQEKPKVVIGTVKGDVHAVGKDMVATMLTVGGFDVKDVGADVDSEVFITAAEEFGAQIIGLSALMSTTMPSQKEVIDFLEAKGLRNKYKVLVGGGPVTPQWAEQIGADGFSKDAVDAG